MSKGVCTSPNKRIIFLSACLKDTFFKPDKFGQVTTTLDKFRRIGTSSDKSRSIWKTVVPT